MALTFFFENRKRASTNVARRGGGKAKQGAPWSHHPVRALVSAERVEVTSESDSRHELGTSWAGARPSVSLVWRRAGTVPTARHHVALPHKTAVAADALIWLVKTESQLWKQ